MAKDTQTPKKSTAVKKSGIKPRYIAGAAILVIIGVGYVLYSLYGTLPASLASTLLSGKPVTAQTLSNAILQKVYSSKTFSSDYTGSISLNGQSSEIAVSFLKANGNATVVYGLENTPFIGTGNITVVTSINGTSPSEICVPTALALFKSDPLPTNQTYFCAESGSANYTILTNTFYSVLNLDQAQNLNISSYSLSSYNSQPCYQATGTAEVPLNRELINETGTTDAAVSFSTCLSAQYNIPLTLSATVNFLDVSSANDTILLNLGQSSQSVT